MNRLGTCTNGRDGWAALGSLGVMIALVVGAFASWEVSKPGASPAKATADKPASTLRLGSDEGGIAGTCPASQCVGGDCTLTQSLDTVTDAGNQVACGIAGVGTTPNGWARCYNLAAEGVPAGNFTVNSVTFGVQQATMDGINIDVVLYLDTDGCPPTNVGVDAAMLCKQSIVVNMADEGTMITVAFPEGPVVPSGSDLIVEIVSVDDGTVAPEFSFRAMSNGPLPGQCGPSYLRTPDGSCGLAGWTDVAAIGFPDAHLIQIVSGTVGGTPAVCGNGIVEGCEECDPPGGDCDPNCQLGTTGACCNFDGAGNCAQMTADACAATATGNYLGDGTLCADCSGIPPECGPGAGPCDQPNGTPGCEDIECCAAVCDVNPFCCSVLGWDQTCVDIAADLCAPDPACGVAGTGDCFDANGTPFCDDNCAGAACSGCCDTVCGVDAFCCDTQWDQICADEAVDLCGCTPADVPPNDDCVNAEPVSEGVFAFSTLCASHDGPTSPTTFPCDEKGGPVPGAGLEVWFDYTASFTGTARAHTCGQADYDTELVVYEGCACPAPDANIIDCNDTGPTCPVGDTGSEVVFDVVAGNCYKIAVGGFYAFAGTGTVTIEPSVIPDACVNGIGDCLQANGTVGCSDQACCSAVCASNPNCCDVDWDQACADTAAVQCVPLPCGPIDTSAANVDEGEPCGDDVNGGCNSVPPAFTDIVSGDVIAGTAWADAGTRDTDWYRISVSAADDADGDGQVDIHYNLLAELAVTSFLIVDPVGNCDLADLQTPGTVAYSQSCTQVGFGVATVAAPGEYFVFAAPGTSGGGAIFEGFPCNPPGPSDFGNNYVLCVNVVDDGGSVDTTCPGTSGPPCPWDLNGDTSVGILDLLSLLTAWGTNPGGPPDFDGDGNVGILDLLELLTHWGPCP